MKLMAIDLTARRYASALPAVVVCLSVCLSVTSLYSIKTDRAAISGTHPSIDLSCTVYHEQIRYLAEHVSCLWDFVPNRGLRENFATARLSGEINSGPTTVNGLSR